MQTKISRRTMLKWLAVSAGGATLAACAPAAAPPAASTAAPAAGSTKPIAGPTAAPAAKGAVEIGWARHGAEEDLKTEGTLADLFAAKVPDVKIKPIVLPWDDYNTKIPVMVAGGTAPDTFGAHPALLIETYNAKGLRVIDDYIKADATLNYDDIVYPGDAKFDGKVVGLPQKSCCHMLRYNKDLFQKAGLPTPVELYTKDKEKSWNWQTFIDMGQKLTKGQDQFFVGGFGTTEIVSIIREAGGELFDDALTKSTLDQPAAKEGLQFMADLVRKYKIEPPPEMKANELGINFPTGKLALEGATTCDQVRDLRKGHELPFTWGYVPLPAGKAGFRAWGDTDQIIIASSSKNPDAAYKWMAYRSSKAAWDETYAKGVFLAFSDGPTRKSIFASKAYTEPLVGIDPQMILDGYSYTIPNPYTPRVPQANNVLNTIIPTEVDNILRGVKTVDQAAADMVKQINVVIAKKA